ncbi:neuropeptide FF receptor 1-like [Clytia hemisphaerica]|uniref:G-protein coupled receptors family 1 profile domain-containing protein n=1 Tax=Clytia hemisphaerica TaxID=252671 RepID=A0A7M5WW87_9CNID
MFGGCNVTTLAETDQIDIPEISKAFFVVIFTLLSITASVLNMLIIYLFLTNRSLRTISNKFIISLAVGDVLMGTLLGPSKIFALLNIQDCSLKTLGQTVTSTMAVSGVTIGCIAYDRFLYVKSINHYNNKRTQQYLMILVIVPWFMVLVLLATKLASELSNAVMALCLVLGIYAFIIFCYTKLIQLLRKSVQIAAKNETTTSTTANTERNLKMVSFVKLILVTAIAFTFPIVINRTMHIIYLSMDKNWIFYQRRQTLIILITHCSFILNSSINPVLYCWKHQGFRKACKRTFKRQDQQRVRFARTPKIYPLDNKMDGRLVAENSQTS